MDVRDYFFTNFPNLVLGIYPIDINGIFTRKNKEKVGSFIGCGGRI